MEIFNLSTPGKYFLEIFNLFTPGKSFSELSNLCIPGKCFPEIFNLSRPGQNLLNYPISPHPGNAFLKYSIFPHPGNPFVKYLFSINSYSLGASLIVNKPKIPWTGLRQTLQRLAPHTLHATNCVCILFPMINNSVCFLQKHLHQWALDHWSTWNMLQCSHTWNQYCRRWLIIRP